MDTITDVCLTITGKAEKVWRGNKADGSPYLMVQVSGIKFYQFDIGFIPTQGQTVRLTCGVTPKIQALVKGIDKSKTTVTWFLIKEIIPVGSGVEDSCYATFNAVTVAFDPEFKKGQTGDFMSLRVCDSRHNLFRVTIFADTDVYAAVREANVKKGDIISLACDVDWKEVEAFPLDLFKTWCKPGAEESRKVLRFFYGPTDFRMIAERR